MTMGLAIGHHHGVLGEESAQDVKDPSRDSHVVEDGEKVSMVLPVEGLVVVYCSEDDALTGSKIQVTCKFKMQTNYLIN